MNANKDEAVKMINSIKADPAVGDAMIMDFADYAPIIDELRAIAGDGLKVTAEFYGLSITRA